MSVIFSGTNQGTFTSTGNAQIIQLPSSADYLWVYNETQQYAAGAGQGVQFYWRRGMTDGRGTIYTKTAVTNALAVAQIAAGAGFSLVDTSINVPSAAVALTGIDNGTPPTVFTGSTSGLVNGDIVRIYSTVGALQLQTYDFTINNVQLNTSFDLAYMAAIANANPGAGTWRRIPYDPYFYPRTRLITKISQATQAIVTLSVTHGYTVGQTVRFVIPTVTATAFGMTELNDLQGTIVAVGQADADGVTNTITVDIDTSGFSAFAFPLTASTGKFTPAQIVPVGENTAEALSAGTNLLADARENQALMGIRLAAGAASPAGVANDVISWVAGNSFSVNNN